LKSKNSVIFASFNLFLAIKTGYAPFKTQKIRQFLTSTEDPDYPLMKLLLPILACLLVSGAIAQTSPTDSLYVKQEIDSLLRQSNLALTAQRYEAAQAAAEAARTRAAGYFGENSLPYADCLNTLAAVAYKQGKFAEAKPRWQQSVLLVEKLTGRNTVLYASRITNLGALYKAMAQFDSAEYVYKEAIRIYELDTATMKAAYANTLNNLANLYSGQSRYAEAEPLLMTCLSLRSRLLGKEHEDYANALDNLGSLKKHQGRAQEAEAYYKEALQIVEKRIGKTHRDYARILNNLANLYRSNNNFDAAERLLLESVQIRAAVLGKEHPDYARGVASMALLFTETSRYEQALRLYEEALRIQEKTIGKEHPNYAVTLHNKAVLLRMLGKYFDAEEQYLRVIELQEKTIGKETDDCANSLRNLGFLYQILGRSREGIQLLREAQGIYTKIHGPKHQEVAKTTADLAAIYYKIGQFDQAEQLYREALPVLEATLGDQHPEYYLRMQNLALLYASTSRYDESLTILNQIKNRFPEKMKNGSEYAELLYNLGFICTKQGKLAESEQFYNESIQTYAAFAAAQNPGYIQTLLQLGLLYSTTSQHELAVSLLQKAHSEEMTLLSTTLRQQSEAELIKYLSTFSRHTAMLYSANQFIGDSNPILREKSYDNALFFKNIVLDLVNQRTRLTQSDTAVQVSQNMIVYRRRLQKALNAPPAERDSARIAEWEEKANALEKELARIVDGYGDLIRQVSWKAVQRQLQPGEAAVELVSYRYQNLYPTDSILYAALVVLPTDTAPHFIPLFEERQLQALLHRPELGEELTVKGLYAPNSELLHLLWTPLEPLLRNVKTVYYAPAGLLHRVNPAALRDADKQPLSAGREWVRVGSTRELVTGRLADRSYALDPNASATAAVWGGIRYDMDSTAFAAANPLDPNAGPLPEFERKDGKFRYMVEEGSPALSSSNGRRGGDIDGWEPLPGSRQETNQVDSLLQRAGFRTEVLTGYRATEERFKALGQSASSPRILHVATHGFAYPDPKKEPQRDLALEEPVYKLQDDPMLRSGLILAGANHYWAAKRPLQNREDGVLVAYEVRDLNLRNTELAVLSACQTGLGDVVGSEGVYGLQRAFHIAGAKFLIVSLWQVPDEQTRELMRLFYENWVDKREPLRDAFNHAQATLRAQEPNPYRWAGFVLIE
jgi:CHAT domain-containing protein/tetratricopeptide (TPR) repeat protein